MSKATTEPKSPADEQIENQAPDTPVEGAESSQESADSPQASTPEVEQPAAEAKPKRRKPMLEAVNPSDKVYVTKDEHSIPFDIQIKGEVIAGQWARTDKRVEFLVPAHLIEGFEQHYHFTIGNVSAAE